MPARIASLFTSRGIATILVLSLVTSVAVSAQAPGKEDLAKLRKQAMDGFAIENAIERLPLLEKLVLAEPDDAEVLENLAVALLVHSSTLDDDQARVAERKRAYDYGRRALDLGRRTQMLDIVMDIPPDGSFASFHDSTEVEAAMQEGERAFSRGDLEQAAASYQRAFKLAPTLYEAPLFMGDVHYKKKEWEQAAEWFARAIAVDPNRETAYRYWGDALLMNGRADEARSKYIEAIIAQPYDRTSWRGIFNWAGRTGVQLSHPHIQSPNKIEEKDGKTNITIDSDSLDSTDGRPAWMWYEITRAAWKSAKFKEQFPDEPEYRHSLTEEADALRGVLQGLALQKKDGKVKELDASLAALARLEEQGLLEAYVLFARANEGIARDFFPYRDAHRDKLRLYLETYVAPLPKPAP